MANIPLSNITTTWNQPATTLNALKLNITDTASAAASLLFDFQVNSISKLSLRKDGILNIPVGSVNSIQYLDASKNLSSTSTFTFDGTNLGLGTAAPTYKFHLVGSAYIQDNLTLNARTANQVAFIDGSKMLSGNANFTYNGTSFLVGTAPNTLALGFVSGTEIAETVSGIQVKLASQPDIGTAPNQIPLNQYLGGLAYRDNPMTMIPASATAAGDIGDIAQDGSYLYVCISQNSWKRVAIAAW